MTSADKVLASVYLMAAGVTIDCTLDNVLTGQYAIAILTGVGAIWCALIGIAKMRSIEPDVVIGFEDQGH